MTEVLWRDACAQAAAIASGEVAAAELVAAYLDRGTAFKEMGNRGSARADFQTVLDMKGKGRAVDEWAKKRAQELLDELGSSD